MARACCASVLLVCVAATVVISVFGHDHCCNKHMHGEAESNEELIPDTSAVAPEVYHGEPRLIPNPEEMRPDFWDDEDDGQWEPSLIQNPRYHWDPPMIIIPNYYPPPGFWDKLKDEIFEAIPWVVLGVAVTTVLAVLQIPLDHIREYLGGDGCCGTVGGAIRGALMGLATPLCSCGSLPVAGGLVSAGVPLSTVVAFLTASQSSGLDSAAVTYGLLGRTAAVCRLLGAVLLAFSAALAVPHTKPYEKRRDKDVSGSTYWRDREGDSCNGTAHSASPQCCIELKKVDGTLAFFGRAVTTAADTALDVFPLVLLGLALSTAAVHYLPALAHTYENFVKVGEAGGSFTGWGSAGPILMRLAVLAAALPLQLCEHAAVTIAAGIQKAGGSPGLSFAFLLSAPATNVPSLLFVLQAASARHEGSGAALASAAIRIGVVLSVAALLLSLLVDAIGLDLLVRDESDILFEGRMEKTALPPWYVLASPFLSAGLASLAMVRAFAGG